MLAVERTDWFSLGVKKTKSMKSRLVISKLVRFPDCKGIILRTDSYHRKRTKTMNKIGLVLVAQIFNRRGNTKVFSRKKNTWRDLYTSMWMFLKLYRRVMLVNMYNVRTENSVYKSGTFVLRYRSSNYYLAVQIHSQSNCECYG